MKQAIDDALAQLSALTTLPLERHAISQTGISGQGGRLAGISAGRGIVIAFSRTITGATAVIMPEGAAGALVRRLGSWTQDNPEAWRAAVRETTDQNLSLTITVNHEILDDPEEIPGGFGDPSASNAGQESPHEPLKTSPTASSKSQVPPSPWH